MGQDLFSVPIFFIVFRETIEASIIICVLLSFVEQLMFSGSLSPENRNEKAGSLTDGSNPQAIQDEAADLARTRKIVRRMRIQIWAGTLSGFFIALCIGAAFIAVFYTKLTNLWANTEALWEGIFSLIAAILIFLMGIAFLKMDRSRVKWRIKLSEAFDDHATVALHSEEGAVAHAANTRRARGGKWALFLLPFITVLREGLECVVFVGGVSLGLPAKSIPIPVVVGLIAGGIIGYAIYRTGSTFALHWFLVVSTSILFLVGAGLFSKAVGFLKYYQFTTAVGADVGESGNGPGSFEVAGNVWHLPYGNPEVGAPGTNGGWQVFNAILGWNNEANLGTILSYCFYWIAIIFALIYYKWAEGRITFFGRGSSAHRRRLVRRGEQREKENASYQSGSIEETASHEFGDKKVSPGGSSDDHEVPVTELRG